MIKKSKISLDLKKKDAELCYKAALFCYPEFTALEYQCSKKQLKDFKKIVIGFWLGRCSIEQVFKDENNKK